MAQCILTMNRVGKVVPPKRYIPAKAAGMSYTALVNRIVQLGLSCMPEWRLFEA